MNLTLYRTIYAAEYTIGRLFVDGEFECWTLEDTVRSGEKVPGETAIPAGTYRVIVDLSRRFGRMMMHVLEVPNFSGIRIHAGNTAADTEGCILVGTKRARAAVLHSRDALEALQAKVERALSRGHEVSLKIENDYPLEAENGA